MALGTRRFALLQLLLPKILLFEKKISTVNVWLSGLQKALWPPSATAQPVLPNWRIL